MNKGYLRNVVNEAYVKRPLPKLGQVVTKAYSEQDDQRQIAKSAGNRKMEKADLNAVRALTKENSSE